MNILKFDGIVVLAGRLDPFDNIGTARHFGLIPIPWAEEYFEETVVHMLRCDLEWREYFEAQIRIPPHDHDEEVWLLRGVGLRAWIITGENSAVLTRLLENPQSKRHFSDAEKIINSNTMHAPSIEYAWPDENFNDSKWLNEFRSLIVSQLG